MPIRAKKFLAFVVFISFSVVFPFSVFAEGGIILGGGDEQLRITISDEAGGDNARISFGTNTTGLFNFFQKGSTGALSTLSTADTTITSGLGIHSLCNFAGNNCVKYGQINAAAHGVNSITAGNGISTLLFDNDATLSVDVDGSTIGFNGTSLEVRGIRTDANPATNVATGNSVGDLIFDTGTLEVKAWDGDSWERAAVDNLGDHTATNNVDLGNETYKLVGGGASGMMVDNTGNVTVEGTVTSSSDVRLKKDIEPLKGALDKLMDIVGVTYRWKTEANRGDADQIGLIAQNVETVYPQLVHEGANGYKSVNYAAMVAPLLEAVKELKIENDALKARLDAAGL